MADGAGRAVPGRAALGSLPLRRLRGSLPAVPPSSHARGRTPTTSEPTLPKLDVWQRRVGRQLSDEDARQIRENLCGFFRVLAEWDLPSTTEGAPSQAPAAERSQP